MNDRSLRRNLLELLDGGHAHVTPEKAFAGLGARYRTARARSGHTLWELLEHLRLAQEDILRYTLDASWESPQWPDGYWPSSTKPTADQWQASLAAFERDLGEVRDLARTTPDLTAEIPHGEGRTYLRQVLLVADHNAYHVGQVVAVRRELGAWS